MGSKSAALAGLRPSYLVIARGGAVKWFRSAESANSWLRKKPRHASR